MSKQEASLGLDPVMRSKPSLPPERELGQGRLRSWGGGGTSGGTLG